LRPSGKAESAVVIACLVRRASWTLRGRGHVVVDLGPEDALNEEVLSLVLMTDKFHQIHEVRMVLETGIAAMAAARVSDDGIRELEAVLRDADKALTDHEAFLDLTWQFHRKLAELSENQVMVKLIGIINRMIRKSETKLYSPFVSPQSELDLHKRLLEAVATRDPERAREAMVEHIVSVDQVVRKAAKHLQQMAQHQEREEAERGTVERSRPHVAVTRE